MKFDSELARDGSVDPVDKALYAALASFVDADARTSDPDPDGKDVPTRATLARCIGRSVDTVDRATKRLEDRGLLSVERRCDPDNPRLHLPSVYELLDYERWDERAAARAEARRAARKEPPTRGGSRTDAARGSRTDAARGSRTDAARGSRTDAALRKRTPEENPDPDARVRARTAAADVDEAGPDGRTDEASLTEPAPTVDEFGAEPVEVDPEVLTRAGAIVAGLDLARLDARPSQITQITRVLAEVLSLPGVDAAQVESYAACKLAEARTVKYFLGAFDASRLVELAAHRPAAARPEVEPCAQHPGASRRPGGECAGCFADRAAVDVGARAEVG